MLMPQHLSEIGGGELPEETGSGKLTGAVAARETGAMAGGFSGSWRLTQ
jgi:hypothetical protein